VGKGMEEDGVKNDKKEGKMGEGGKRERREKWMREEVREGVAWKREGKGGEEKRERVGVR